MSGLERGLSARHGAPFWAPRALATALSLALLLALARSATAMEPAASEKYSTSLPSSGTTEANADILASPISAPPVAPLNMVSRSVRDLLGEIPPPGLPRGDVVGDASPFAFPPETSIRRPVAIPFPTAVHLFVPGAIMVIYATRRFRRRSF